MKKNILFLASFSFILANPLSKGPQSWRKKLVEVMEKAKQDAVLNKEYDALANEVDVAEFSSQPEDLGSQELKALSESVDAEFAIGKIIEDCDQFSEAVRPVLKKNVFEWLYEIVSSSFDSYNKLIDKRMRVFHQKQNSTPTAQYWASLIFLRTLFIHYKTLSQVRSQEELDAIKKSKFAELVSSKTGEFSDNLEKIRKIGDENKEKISSSEKSSSQKASGRYYTRDQQPAEKISLFKRFKNWASRLMQNARRSRS